MIEPAEDALVAGTGQPCERRRYNAAVFSSEVSVSVDVLKELP